MCPGERVPTVVVMNTNITVNTRHQVSWRLIIGLAAIALVRPLVSIVESVLGVSDPPAVPILLTLLVSTVWVAVVGLGRTARPVLTLVLTGLSYAAFALLLSAVLSPILTGRLQGPLANPFALVPFFGTNALWGLVAGGLALLVQHIRSGRPVR